MARNREVTLKLRLAPEKIDSTKAAFDAVNDELKRGAAELERINALLDPSLLARRASLVVQQKLAQEAYNDALKREVELRAPQRAVFEEDFNARVARLVAVKLEQQELNKAVKDAIELQKADFSVETEDQKVAKLVEERLERERIKSLVAEKYAALHPQAAKELETQDELIARLIKERLHREQINELVRDGVRIAQQANLAPVTPGGTGAAPAVGNAGNTVIADAAIHRGGGADLNAAAAAARAAQKPFREYAAALDDVEGGLKRQEAAIKSLNLALRPDMLQRRIELEREERELRKQMQDALDKEFKLETLTNETLQSKAERAVNTEIAQRNLNEAIKVERERRFGIAVDAERTMTAEERRVNAIKNVNEALATQKQRIADMQRLLDPKKLAEQLRLQRQFNALRSQHAETMKVASESPFQRFGEGYGRGRGWSGLFGGLAKTGRGAMGLVGGLFSKGGKGGGGGPLGEGEPSETPEGGGGGGGGMMGLTNMAGAVGMAVGATIDLFSKMGSELMKLVAIGAPASVREFNFALRDTQAVVGQAFSPIIDTFTEFVRLLGDFLATVLPSGGEMKELMSTFEEVFSELRESLAAIAPIVKDLVKGALWLLTKALKVLAEILIFPLRVIKELMGTDANKKLESSTGRGPRNASFGTLEDAAKQIYVRAYMSGAGRTTPPKSHIEKVADNTAKLVQGVAAIIRLMNELGGGSGLPDAINQLLKKWKEDNEEAGRAGDATAAALYRPAAPGIETGGF